MGHKVQMYENLRDMLEREIGEIERKRDIDKESLDNLFKLTSSLKVVDKCIEKHEQEDMMKSGGVSMMSNQSNAQGGNSGNSMTYPYMGMGYPIMSRGMSNASNASYASNGSYESNASNAGGSYGSYEGGQSGARGQNNNRGSYDGGQSGENSNGRRGRDGDGDGRYNESRDNFRDSSSRDSYGRSYGYSRDAAKKKMVQKLETLMDDTMSEKERKAIQECISEIDK